MKKNRKYIMSVVLALAMVLNVFLPAGAARASAEVGAETEGTGTDVTDILTNPVATVTQDGKTIGDGGTLTTDDISVKVSFGVPVEGDNPSPAQAVHQGDTATFELSQGFTLLSGTGPTPIYYQTKTPPEKILVGYVSFSTDSDKKVTATVTFDGNEKVFDGTYGSVSCEFDASLAYDKNGDAGNTGDHTVQILDKTFTVNVPAPEIQYQVEKQGSADLANKRIHWTATVTATQDGTGVDLAGYRFSDELGKV